jgi:hypothetical protein
MTAMDVSIYYNKFLINGKNESQIEGFSAPPLSVDDFGARKFKAGDKVRLKISNGGASTFWLRDMLAENYRRS